MRVCIIFMQQHLSRIVQSVIALVLLVLTITSWSQNRIGQNIINLQTVAVCVIGLENLIMAYRWFIGKQGFEYELGLLLFIFYVMAKMFEKYHPTEVRIQFNLVCEYTVVTVLAVNVIFFLFIMLVVVVYAVRQIYRLMTETLLSTNANLQPAELTQILAMKKAFSSIQEEYADVSKTCSICLAEFDPQVMAIILPGCEHCFHNECIQKWLQAKSTCPYCRNNIRLNLI